MISTSYHICDCIASFRKVYQVPISKCRDAVCIDDVVEVTAKDVLPRAPRATMQKSATELKRSCAKSKFDLTLNDFDLSYLFRIQQIK
jgi:hypothetical protein